MPRRKKASYRKIKRRSRGKIIYSLARTTKRGKGRIKKRQAYKKYMGTKRKRKVKWTTMDKRPSRAEKKRSESFFGWR
jgi:hypothetical protein